MTAPIHLLKGQKNNRILQDSMWHDRTSHYTTICRRKSQNTSTTFGGCGETQQGKTVNYITVQNNTEPCMFVSPHLPKGGHTQFGIAIKYRTVQDKTQHEKPMPIMYICYRAENCQSKGEKT